MKNEAELVELLDDIDDLIEDSVDAHRPPSVHNACLHGLAAGLAHALDLSVEKCGNRECTRDHKADRLQGIAHIREEARNLRAKRRAARQ